MDSLLKFRSVSLLNSIVHLFWGAMYWELFAYSREIKEIILAGILFVVLLVAAALTQTLRDKAKTEYELSTV